MDYLGLGLGAHSFINGVRFSNLREFGSYIGAWRQRDKKIIKNGVNNALVEWSHRNTRQDDISEYIFTGMRKIQGIDLVDFKARFGQDIQSLYSKEIEGFIKDKLVKIVDSELRFTPKGIDISNKVLAEFV